MNVKLCNEELLTAYVDGELSSEQSSEVVRHLEECPACRSVCGELQALHDLVVESAAAEEATTDFDRIWKNIQAGLEDERPASRKRSPGSWLSSFSSLLTAAAATAALALAVMFMPHTVAPPAKKAVSRIESVACRSGSLLVLQTEGKGEPVIWMLMPKKTDKGANS